MKITKIYFPMITVIRLEGEGMEPKYFTNVKPEEPTYPVTDIIMGEKDWKRALWEAKEKGARVVTYEV